MITALVWSERLLALAVIFQTLELIKLKGIWADDGIWRWNTVKRDYHGLPKVVLNILDYFLQADHFNTLLKVRLFTAFLVWFIHPAIFIAILFFSTWLIAIRWRGIFNGGSDSMTALIALALTIAQACNNHSLIVKACFAYIAVQVLASYFLAGLAKVKNEEWRKGLALAEFFRTPRYDSPPPKVRALIQNPNAAKKISWTLMVFELSFPLALASPMLCTIYILLGLSFHLVNFYVFGLNRFFFAWAAAYPALYFWSARGQ